jgi:integrase
MPRRPNFGRIFKPKKKRPDGKRIEIAVWWIEFYHNARQIRESSRSRRYKDAENLLRQRLVEIEAGSYAGALAEKLTVGELLDDLIADFEENGKSVEWMRYVAGHLRPFFGHARATQIQSRHLRAYIKHRRTEGVGNSTINRELARLKRAFNLAREATPPRVKWVPNFPKLTEPPARRGFFEYEEFLTMRSQLPEHLRPVITFAYYTGCRKGEILNLRWDQVDSLAKLVRLEPGETKNDEARTIPLIGELHEMLVMQKQIRDQRWPGCPWVFFRYGKKIKDFRGAWDEAAKRAGLWAEESERPKRIFHDLRRTGARNLVRAGVPERVVMAIGGWKTRSVFDRYNIVSERDLHEAAAKLERHFNEVEKARDKATSRQLSDSHEFSARKLLN